MPGQRSRSRRIVSAKTDAPPSGRSSRATDVTTTCSRPMAATASATRRGSSGSNQVGRPVLIAQKPQARVQTSPRIITVAVRWSQHSPRFGQRASSQTVLRFRPRRRTPQVADGLAGRHRRLQPVGVAARARGARGPGHVVGASSAPAIAIDGDPAAWGWPGQPSAPRTGSSRPMRGSLRRAACGASSRRSARTRSPPGRPRARSRIVSRAAPAGGVLDQDEVHRPVRVPREPCSRRVSGPTNGRFDPV